MQGFNPDLHLVQVAELCLLVGDLPMFFAEALQEGQVVHALQHATSAVDRTIMLVTARRKL